MRERLKLKTETYVVATTWLGWVAIGTIGFHILESWNWIHSFYFSVVTISTVVYGDFAPAKDISS